MVVRLPIPVRTGTTLDTVLKVLRSNAVVRAATGRLRLTSSWPEIRARYPDTATAMITGIVVRSSVSAWASNAAVSGGSTAE